MALKHLRNIPAFFNKYAGSGDFSCPSRNMPYNIILPSRRAKTVIYCTKPSAIVDMIGGMTRDIGYGLIARRGLPAKKDLHLFHEAMNCMPVVFLGDMDPPDLLTYIWIKYCLGSDVVHYLGVSDLLLDNMNIPFNSIHSLNLNALEINSIDYMNEAFPSWKDSVGNNCEALLGSKKKVELEAVVYSKAFSTNVFINAIKTLLSNK